MSNSDWGGETNDHGVSIWLLAGFGALCAVCLWLGYLDSQADQYRYESEEAKKLAIKFCADRVTDPTCLSDFLSAYQEQTYSQKDVRAQEQMAIYALLMLVVTGIGVVYVAGTLNATRQTLSEAQRATRAAEEAVEVTRDIGQAQVRAYLTIAKVSFSIPADRSYQTVTITLLNSGQSPARKLNFYSRLTAEYIAFDPETADMIKASDSDILLAKQRPNNVAAGSPEKFSLKTINNKFGPQIANPGHIFVDGQSMHFDRLVLSCRIVFEDVFEDETTISFKAALDIPRDGLPIGPQIMNLDGEIKESRKKKNDEKA